MNQYLSYILIHIDKAPKQIDPDFNFQRYMGTGHTFLGIPTIPKRQIARDFKKKFPDISPKELFTTLDALYQGKTFEEKTLASEILAQYKIYFDCLEKRHFQTWLRQLEGWAEIDTLCQSTFNSIFFLSDWKKWESMFLNFAKSKNIQERRASLVLLCKPLRESSDIRLRDIAVKNIQTLQKEKNILITKAISWVLREMIKHHKNFVTDFLDANTDSLPKIALRETRKKLLTGKK